MRTPIRFFFWFTAFVSLCAIAVAIPPQITDNFMEQVSFDGLPHLRFDYTGAFKYPNKIAEKPQSVSKDEIVHIDRVTLHQSSILDNKISTALSSQHNRISYPAATKDVVRPSSKVKTSPATSARIVESSKNQPDNRAIVKKTSKDKSDKHFSTPLKSRASKQQDHKIDAKNRQQQQKATTPPAALRSLQSNDNADNTHLENKRDEQLLLKHESMMNELSSNSDSRVENEPEDIVQSSVQRSKPKAVAHQAVKTTAAQNIGLPPAHPLRSMRKQVLANEQQNDESSLQHKAAKPKSKLPASEQNTSTASTSMRPEWALSAFGIK